MTEHDDEHSEVSLLANAKPFEERLELYQALLTFLRDTHGALGKLVHQTHVLDSNLRWLLNSKRWKAGSTIAHPILVASHSPSPVAVLSQNAVEAAHSWVETKSYAYSVFIDSLMPPDSVDGGTEPSEFEETINTQFSQLYSVVQESIFDVQQISGTLIGVVQDARKLLDSWAWRVGDILVNRILKRITRNPYRDYVWAPHKIQELHKNVNDLVTSHEQRCRTLQELLSDRLGQDICLAPSSPLGQGASILSKVSLYHQGPLKELPLHDRIVSIIVPVYNAYEELRPCIESLIAHTDSKHSLILLDDASPDERVWPLLQKYAEEYGQITIKRNTSNLGFPANINQGFEMTDGDVIILNSDTEVTPRWVEKLIDAAYTKPHVATVTPLTNSGSAFSVPEMHKENEIPEFLNSTVAADIVERYSRWIRPEVPTGNGFCMYIRREALDRVGTFDDKAFPRGYGEENDFCVRASGKGFVHLIDDATFIYHKENASFLEDAQVRKKHALETIRGMHPDYEKTVTTWLEFDELSNLRYNLERIWKGQRTIPVESYMLFTDRPTLLYIVHDSSGGTIRHVEDLAQGIWSRYRCLALFTAKKEWKLNAYLGKHFQQIDEFHFDEEWNIIQSMNAERVQAIDRIIETYAPEIVHIHHFMWNSPEILPIFKRANAKTILSLHDFYTVCPSYNLLDQSHTFCGGKCTEGEGACGVELKGVNIPNLKHDYVYTWRERMVEYLASCDYLIGFSNAGRDIVTAVYPQLDNDHYLTIGHGQDLDHFTAISSPPGTPPVRVVLVGALGLSKGIELIRGVLEINSKNQGPFEFHFVGSVHPSLKPDKYGALVHGPYAHSELPDILARIQPSFAMIASICAETFSYTLSECWAAGLPVMGSDIGTLRERITRSGCGWLLDHTDAERWYQKMCSIADNTGEYAKCMKKIDALHLKTIEEMHIEYQTLYGRVRQVTGAQA